MRARQSRLKRARWGQIEIKYKGVQASRSGFRQCGQTSCHCPGRDGSALGIRSGISVRERRTIRRACSGNLGNAGKAAAFCKMNVCVRCEASLTRHSRRHPTLSWHRKCQHRPQLRLCNHCHRHSLACHAAFAAGCTLQLPSSLLPLSDLPLLRFHPFHRLLPTHQRHNTLSNSPTS